MQLNRTKNSIRSSFWGILNKLVIYFLPFLVRTALIKKIGEEYLGLTGLFTAILSVLSLTECGFGAAIVYSMYKPIAADDTDTVCALLSYYRRIYHIVGLLIFVIGILLFPFLPHLIKGEYPIDINLYVLYSIYLANTVLSYFLFAYKASLFSAFQRNDIASKISILVNAIKNFLQLAVLTLLHNYMAYVVIIPATTLLNNVITNIITRKLFPAVKPIGQIDSAMQKSIKKQVVGLFVGRLASITKNSVDSIFISFFIGLTAVAVYSNYYYIIFAVYGFLDILCVSMQAGIGNSIAVDSIEKNFSDFKNLTFIFSWLVSVCCVCLLCLMQLFMQLWMGEILMLPFVSVILFAVYFYVMAVNDVMYQYYNANGLWWFGKYKSIVDVCVNIVLNFVLIRFYEINGIIIATIVSHCISDIWTYFILSRRYFKNCNTREYVKIIIKNCILAVGSCVTLFFLCKFVTTVVQNQIILLLVNLMICLVGTNVILFGCNWHTPLFKESRAFLVKRLVH